MEKHKIYCITQEKEYFKIGHTLYRVQQRLTSMQVGNPKPLKIFWVISTHKADVYEQQILEKYSDYNLRGEWFDFSVKIANQIKNSILSEKKNKDLTLYDSSKHNYVRGVFERLKYYGEISNSSKLVLDNNEFKIIDGFKQREIHLKNIDYFINNKLNYDEYLFQNELRYDVEIIT